MRKGNSVHKAIQYPLFMVYEAIIDGNVQCDFFDCQSWSIGWQVAMLFLYKSVNYSEEKSHIQQCHIGLH